MKLGFLYAGQGAQKVGMGADLYNSSPAFAAVYDAVSLDFDVKEISFTDTDNKLNLTQYTQPCMVTFAIAMTEFLRQRGIVPSAATGLSLGEYSALYTAGVWDAQTAIRTVAFRGKAMASAVEGMDCAMYAVLGMDRAPLEAICHEASTLGVVCCANYNCSGQIVIGGETVAVNQAVALAKEAGAKRCLPLKVSGPFHTPLLKQAGDDLADYFKSISFHPPQIPVMFNCLGSAMTTADTIPALLERQVQTSVYMEDCIRTLASQVDVLVEIGPGTALKGFAKKIAPSLPCYSVETLSDVEALETVLQGEAL